MKHTPPGAEPAPAGRVTVPRGRFGTFFFFLKRNDSRSVGVLFVFYIKNKKQCFLYKKRYKKQKNVFFIEKARKTGRHRRDPGQKHVFCAFQEKAIPGGSLLPQFEKKWALFEKKFPLFQKNLPWGSYCRLVGRLLSVR